MSVYVNHHTSDIQKIQYLLLELAFTEGCVWLPPSYLQFTVFYLSRTSVYHLCFQYLKDLPPSLINIVFNIMTYSPHSVPFL
jgi:hypothetical protein